MSASTVKSYSEDIRSQAESVIRDVEESRNVAENVMGEAAVSIRKAVESLIQKANEISGFISGNVMDDYGKMVKIGEQYNDNAVRINTEIASLESETAQMNERIHGIRDNLNEIMVAISDSTVNIAELNEFFGQIAGEMENLSKMASDHTEHAKQLRECIERYRI